MRTRSLSAVVISGVVVAACAAPAPSSFEWVDEPALETTPRNEPPPDDELEPSGVTDVTVPDPSAGGSSPSERTMANAAAPTAPVTAYLNGEGGTYFAGVDNAGQRISSVLSFYGRQSATAPPTGYQGATWRTLVDCVSEKFARYGVTITDRRPVGPYTEIVVTNAWGSSILGLSNAIGGIAPLGSCRVVPQAVGFVFQPVYDRPGYGGVAGACEAVAHELAHTLSLSHEQLATDLMSYAPANPAKRFQDANVACGVSAQAPEACTCGAATQNSHRQLLAMVGAPAPSGGPTTPGDTVPPVVSIASPANGASAPGNANVTVAVDATDETGLADVRLVWQQTQRALACDDSVQGVTCVVTGNRRTWTIFAGTGARSFYAYAVDGGGNTTSTPLVTISLTGAPPDAPPTVNVQLPVDRGALSRGATIDFQAAASDDRAVADVRAIWTFNGGTLEYPMAQTTTPGVYRATTTVSATATAGWRTVEVAVVDDGGNRTLSPKRWVYVQ
ncbi:MAG: hypothetical protein KF795_24205 [Labilithrix sp.]|nr:hypothetical protein [Labilithrix sp.]